MRANLNQNRKKRLCRADLEQRELRCSHQSQHRRGHYSSRESLRPKADTRDRRCLCRWQWLPCRSRCPERCSHIRWHKLTQLLIQGGRSCIYCTCKYHDTISKRSGTKGWSAEARSKCVGLLCEAEYVRCTCRTQLSRLCLAIVRLWSIGWQSIGTDGQGWPIRQ